MLDWLPEQLGRGMALVGHAEGIYPLAPAWMPADRPIVDPQTITFLPLETLSGRITHADGRPAAGVTVSVSGQGPADGRGGNQWNGSAVTDAGGRYQLQALSEQVYVVAVNGKEWAAPYRAGLVVHAGKPVAGVDFVLGRRDTAAWPRDRRNGRTSPRRRVGSGSTSLSPWGRTKSGSRGKPTILKPR